jgi:hypothetical protein
MFLTSVASSPFEFSTIGSQTWNASFACDAWRSANDANPVRKRLLLFPLRAFDGGGAGTATRIRLPCISTPLSCTFLSVWPFNQDCMSGDTNMASRTTGAFRLGLAAGPFLLSFGARKEIAASLNTLLIV